MTEYIDIAIIGGGQSGLAARVVKAHGLTPVELEPVPQPGACS